MPTVRRPARPLLALLTALCAAGVVADPVLSLASARQGLTLWWTAVLPALLPFFILNDLLQALGVVNALGILLEPVMRLFFALPGAAGFALAVGYTSGFPAGARAAASLTSAGLCTREEGSLLAGFANAAGPLFVTGVVAVSLFGAPAAGPHLALAHYGSALLAGALLASRPRRRPFAGRNLTRRAWAELQAAAETAPPLGQLLGRVVRGGGETALLVGGFIVLFSVFIGLLEGSGLARWLAGPAEWLLQRWGLPAGLATAGLVGLLEVTCGLNRLAAVPGPLPVRLAFASALLAWSGFSVHAQAAAVSAPAGLSHRRFLAVRLLQTGLSPLLFLALWALAPAPVPASPLPAGPRPWPGPAAFLCASAAAFLAVLALLAALGVLAALQRQVSRRF